MTESLIVIGGVLLLYYLVMIPVQYSNIAVTKKEIQRSKLSHNEMYEKKSFEEQELQFNLQGNPINLPATLIAQLIYTIRHRHEK